MENIKTQMSDICSQLEELFDIANDYSFSNSLPKCVIRIATDPNNGKKGEVYGHATTKKVWHEDGTATYEIGIYAEHLDRPIRDIVGTLLHEMVHVYCAENGVQDTSRGGSWHNDKFRTHASLHGLSVEKSDGHGWNVTKLLDSYDNYFSQFTDVYHDIKLNRDYNPVAPVKAKKKSSSIKYVCPHCGAIVRATKELHILCGDCGVAFVADVAES